MPEYNKAIDPLKDRRIGTAVELFKDYDVMLMAKRERGEKSPKRFVLTEILAEE